MSLNTYDSSTQQVVTLAGMASTDSALSSTSTNPVQNRVIKNALDAKADASDVSSLSNALTNKVNVSDIVNNLTETTTGKVLDATQGLALANKHKVTQFTVDTSSWVTDTTSQSGTTLYKKSIALTHVYVESPSVDIGSTGVLPTVAQQDAYNLLQYVTVDSAIPCLYLYASDIPTDSFYINVEGVD